MAFKTEIIEAWIAETWTSESAMYANYSEWMRSLDREPSSLTVFRAILEKQDHNLTKISKGYYYLPMGWDRPDFFDDLTDQGLLMDEICMILNALTVFGGTRGISLMGGSITRPS